MNENESLTFVTKMFRRIWNRSRPTSAPAAFLGLTLLLGGWCGCAPSSESDRQTGDVSSSPGDALELSADVIRERLNGVRVRKIAEENNAAEPISWTFDEDEPKEIAVVEKRVEGGRATILLDIKTQSVANSREPRYLAGQIRTEWILETGWVLRRWEIERADNVSMKYKNLPKPSAPNSNR